MRVAGQHTARAVCARSYIGTKKLGKFGARRFAWTGTSPDVRSGSKLSIRAGELMMPELIEHRFMNCIFYTLSFFCIS